MCKVIKEDPYAKERAMPLMAFVESLFESAKSMTPPGYFIVREDGQKVHIEICPLGDAIIIKMDECVMGRFEEFEGQGYRSAFYQQHRVGIRNGLTLNEAMMRSFCNHPLVRFFNG